MRRFAAMILLAGSLFLLGMCGYILFGMFAQEQKDDALQEQLKIIYEKEDGESTETTESPSVHAGLLALHESNPDCIAWITIEGTVIDYPVMYHPEEENYYLKRDFNGAYSANGSLFISESCDPADCDNLIIYGHHMKSGKMFAALEGYKQREFYEEHPLILLNTLQGLETYQVFAAFCTPVYTGNDFAYYAFTKAGTSDAYDEYVSAVKEKSLYDTGITAVYGEKLLTLSTCEYSQKNGRMVVVAKKID